MDKEHCYVAAQTMSNYQYTIPITTAATFAPSNISPDILRGIKKSDDSKINVLFSSYSLGYISELCIPSRLSDIIPGSAFLQTFAKHDSNM